jgi:hypothetical protein
MDGTSTEPHQRQRQRQRQRQASPGASVSTGTGASASTGGRRGQLKIPIPPSPPLSKPARPRARRARLDAGNAGQGDTEAGGRGNAGPGPRDEKQRGRGRGKPSLRKSPRAGTDAPDPIFFARQAARWRVQLGAFAGRAAAPATLRALLAPSADELEALGAETDVAALPDDLLVAAAVSGPLTSMPFLDILDGGCFARAPCLCCYAAPSAAAAREAAAALRLFQQYYDGASYLGSRAFVRTVAALSRDLRPDEVADVREHVGALDETPDSVRELNAAEGVCVALPACRPGALWIYSTPAGRRLLRHLARGLRKDGAPVRVAVASSDPTLFPRFRYRMYAATLLRSQTQRHPASAAQPDAPTDIEILLAAALAWVRGGGAGPPRGTGSPRGGPSRGGPSRGGPSRGGPARGGLSRGGLFRGGPGRAGGGGGGGG